MVRFLTEFTQCKCRQLLLDKRWARQNKRQQERHNWKQREVTPQRICKPMQSVLQAHPRLIPPKTLGGTTPVGVGLAKNGKSVIIQRPRNVPSSVAAIYLFSISMLLNTIPFFVFFFFVFLLYWKLPKERQWIVLLLASYYFFGSWKP